MDDRNAVANRDILEVRVGWFLAFAFDANVLADLAVLVDDRAANRRTFTYTQQGLM